MFLKPFFRHTGILALTALTFASSRGLSQTITATLLDEETDIINTGGTLVSAVHFQDPVNEPPSPFIVDGKLVVNGIPHVIGSGNEPLLSGNFGFEGDFRNAASGLPTDGTNIVQVLLSGIAGANGITMEITGLEIGKTYLFQAYWEVDRNHTLTTTLEGETLDGIVEEQNQGDGTPGGTLISHTFTATDEIYNAFFDRDDAGGGDPNNWLSGYSLQEAEPPVSTDVEITSITGVGENLWEVSLLGGPETTYELRSATDLIFSPGNLITGLTAGETPAGTIGGAGQSEITTDSEGVAVVRFSSTELTNFIIATLPVVDPL